jgi:pyruvate dehydrogenase E2 component (dihydrolipoamide acetyltransferase)
MAAITEVRVPDIGDFADVPIIEVMVKPGDKIRREDPLVTLESDKATMDVPAPAEGIVKELRIKVGDKVSEGTLLLLLEAAGAVQPAAQPKAPVAAPPAAAHAPAGVADVRVPDIGNFKDVPVIDVLVKPGDSVKPEQPLITLESDKATMDVPAPLRGVVQELKVKAGDKVSEGVVILTLMTDAAASARGAAPTLAAAAPAAPVAAAPAAAGVDAALAQAYAGPAVRKLARELSVDLGRVTGSGDKGRILKADVEAFVTGAPAAAQASARAVAPAAGIGLELLPWPTVDFAKFGPIESVPRSRIKKIAGQNLYRNWVMIPHVTNHDDADITELEEFRVRFNKENEKSGVRVSVLAFMVKAACATLKNFPEFNAALDGDNLILRKYYNIGFAADTPQGLVVPVIRNADQKGVAAIAQEMGDLAKLARESKLKPDQMQGGTFTISSLGGIGNVYFTPIINAPEVAILGACRSFWKQVSPDGKTSSWRFVVPLSLSWDHRVIDGAAAARFLTHFSSMMGDLRRALM